MSRKQKKELYLILAAAVLTAAAWLLERSAGLPGWAVIILWLVPYLLVGHDVLRKAVLGIAHGQVFDENFLMTVSTVGAIAMGEWHEGVAVMLFYQIGELFQSVAVGKSRRSISDLMDIQADTAWVTGEDGTLEETDPEEIEPGSLIAVRPGDRIPIDGVVESGESTVNTAAVTGESRPVSVRPGDRVFSGCVNGSGLLAVRTTAAYEDSTASRILELVENSSVRKAKTEAFITRFARYYTPAVCGAALLLAVIPSLITGDGKTWTMRALSFLVTSCPCALVISIPLTFFGAIGGASRRGILVKGDSYLESLSTVDTVVMDKTGTLTAGTFTVTSACPAEGVSPEQLRSVAAIAETFSSHPIAAALKEEQPVPDPSLVSDGKNYAGKGVSAVFGGKTVMAGNAALMADWGISAPEASSAGTVVHVVGNGNYLGYLVISDTVKETAKGAVEKLKEMGIRTVMLTGDNESTARAVAETLGISEYRAGLLPEDKVSAVEGLLSAQAEGKHLAFAGDGVNDAPVIMRSDVGIAMGALGSDAAIEAADIVLTDDDPAKIPEAVAVSRKCMRIVRQNIALAIGVKLLCLLLVALGAANMWWAVFSDVGVMILAVLNSVRMLSAAG